MGDDARCHGRHPTLRGSQNPELFEIKYHQRRGLGHSSVRGKRQILGIALRRFEIDAYTFRRQSVDHSPARGLRRRVGRLARPVTGVREVEARWRG